MRKTVSAILLTLTSLYAQGQPPPPPPPPGTVTVSIGSTTTLSPGSAATVTNSGTSQNVMLNFGIPQGIQGPQGPQGIQGPQGPAGASSTIVVDANGQILGALVYNDFSVDSSTPVLYVGSLKLLIEPTHPANNKIPDFYFANSDCTGPFYVDWSFVNSLTVSTWVWQSPAGSYIRLVPDLPLVGGGQTVTYSHQNSAGCLVEENVRSFFGPLTEQAINLPFTIPIATPISFQ